jgi:hypothetical protein
MPTLSEIGNSTWIPVWQTIPLSLVYTLMELTCGVVTAFIGQIIEPVFLLP